MTRIAFIIAAFMVALAAGSTDFRFSGNDRKVIAITPEASSGLKAVYVAYSLEGLTVNCSRPDDSTPVVWYSFGPEGAAYAEKFAEGTEITNLSPNRGYIAETGNRREYFWLIDYSSAPYSVSSISLGDESDCSAAEIFVTGSATRLTYSAINGRQIEIDRGITLSYFTLTPVDKHFEQTKVTENLPYLRSTIHTEAPLCATRFVLKGDRFLREWGMEEMTQTDVVTPIAVSAITSVSVDARDVSNEQTDPTDEIGGSAPVTATFSAEVSDAAVFTEWQVAGDEAFENVHLRERSTEFVHTFNEGGSFFVKFTAADASGGCMWESDPYRVSVGESRLRCPNAFSPGASEGVNDVWCVSYRSIIEFDCSIFNRWGVRITRFTDPAHGWDGRYKGRLVDPGVYYYVIKARGADGKIYNLSGDINIIGSR